MNPFDELYADPLTAIVDKVKGLRATSDRNLQDDGDG